jgi:hypothetical protein
VITLALALLLQQAPALTVTAGADRDRVAVGELVTFTVYASAGGAADLSLVTPGFDGFDVVSRAERREVGVTGGRSQTWEFRLRAASPGRWTLGPVQVVQSGVVAQAAPVTVEVLAAGAGVAAALNPRVRALLEAASPPADSGVQVTVLLSSSAALVGQQVDVVTAAWFPRDLRLRLRRPPTLEPPTFSGVWAYPQPVPPGIAATREVGGVWYDLFVHHQVIFPITAGPLLGEAATLRYSVPVAFQFFSQEDRYAVTSAAPRLTVLPLPDDGRPPAFDGAVGTGIALTREVDGMARTGEPLSVRFVLRGRGNVALWPAPFVRWPAGLQVYPEGIDQALDKVGGVLGGTKTFRYLVVPDSSGLLALPTVVYPFFDPEPATYQSSSVAGLRLPVAPPSAAAAARAEPPPLLLGARARPAWRVTHALPAWGWALLWLAVPLLPLAGRRPRWRRRAPAGERHLPEAVRAVRRFDAALERLGAAHEDGDRLARALRGAGADLALAARAVAVRRELGRGRFASGGAGMPPSLGQELGAVCDALEALAHRGPRRGAGLLAGLLLLVGAAGLRAQAAPEQLYQSGAYRAAAEGFAARARVAPAVTANWYGAGAAAYRLGDDGRAAAAWTRAARLAPRDRTLARAMLLVPAPDAVTAEWRAPFPVTREELWVAATLLWLVGWIGVATLGGWRGRWIVILAGALVVAGVAGWRTAEERRPLGLLAAPVPLRVSPHGRAPGGEELPVGTGLRPVGSAAGWVLVRSATGQEGWVPRAAVAWVVAP